jgi:SagB-type dehydrogenase family enzyme
MALTSTQYHNETTYLRHHMGTYHLDWENQPSVYKTYANPEPIPLPQATQLPQGRLSSLLKGQCSKEGLRALELNDLSRIFFLTYSFTAKARHAEEEFYYRSAASAGALYPVEIYVAAHSVKGLGNGLYHFSIAHHGLVLLRRGGLLSPVVMSTQLEGTRAPVLTFFFSAIFFRSAWKYRARAYRYHLLDTGHVIENLMLALAALGYSPTLSSDFDDHQVNRLLGLDEAKEVCLAVCHLLGLDYLSGEDEKELPEAPGHMKEASRVAAKDVSYPLIREMHSSGFTRTLGQHSKTEMISTLGVVPENWIRVNPIATWPEAMNYTESVYHRRSRRNFMRKPMSTNALSALVDGLFASYMEAGATTSGHQSCFCSGLLIGNTEGWVPGFYLLDYVKRSIGRVTHGFLMTRMARSCLDQTWLANAAVHFLFMTNLHMVDELWGARGYRYAMMTAGRMGERLYLTATAIGLGCCGIGAFYDNEVAELLKLNQESRLLYLVAVGPIKSKKG